MYWGEAATALAILPSRTILHCVWQRIISSEIPHHRRSCHKTFIKIYEFFSLASLLADKVAMRDQGFARWSRRINGGKNRNIVGKRSSLFACSAFWILCTVGANAEEPVYDINVPAQNAAKALEQLAEQANAITLFPYDLAQAKQVNAVVGRYTLPEALDVMLEDTGLSSSLLEKRVISITPAAEAERTDEEEPMLEKKTGLLAGLAAILIGQAASAQEPIDTLEEIVVKGIRGSLEAANDRKRAAATFVDGIAAEDLGKFPDQNVAESLQRISGVTINREAGEGSQITVRGFGPEFNLVRVNNRTIATVTDERNFDFQVLPSESIIGADVFKSPAAEMWAGSIGGVVNLRTARPLDVGDLRLAGSIQGRYQDLSEEWGPRATGIFSNVFANETFGVLLGFSYEDREIRTDESRNGEANINGWQLFDGPVNGAGSPEAQFRFPARSGQSFTADDRKRLGAQATFQWEPTDRVSMAFDALYVDYERTSSLQGTIAPLQFPTFDPASLVIDDNGTATSFTKLFGPLDLRFETEDQDSQTTAIGWHGDFDVTDRFSLSGDLSWSKADAYNEAFLIAAGLRDNNPQNNPLPGGATDPAFQQSVITWTNADVPRWSTNLDLSDPTLARAHVNIAEAEKLDDEIIEARLDGSFQIDSGILNSIKFGVFNSDREKTRLPFNDGPFSTADGSFFSDGPRGGNISGFVDTTDGVLAPIELINPSATAIAGRVWQAPTEFFTPINIGNLLSEEGGGFPRDFLLVDVPAFCQWQREFTLNNSICSLFPRTERLTRVEEQVFGAYVQLNLDGELAGMPWSANFGLRYEDTETTASGDSVELISIEALAPDGSQSGLIVNQTPAQTVTVDNSYDNFLPSLNFKMELTDQVVFRAAAAQVMTRPQLNQIIPGQSFNQFNFESFTRTGSNPLLEPYEAWQLDGSLEFYSDNGNAASVTLFYKEIDTFISEVTVISDTGFDHPAFGDILVSDIGPRNRKGGSIQGYELAGLYNFSFLPGRWSNLGVQANYTFVSSEDELANTELNLVLAETPSSGLEGFTPHSFNVIGFYEGDKFRARLAYNWRDTFLELRSGPAGIPAHFDSYGQLDIGLGYKIWENSEITLDVSNVLDENTIRFADIRDRVLLNEYTGTRFFVGFRTSFDR